MSKTTDSIIRIIAAGADLEISAKAKTTENIIRIVQSLQPNQELVLRDCQDKTTDNLIRIAQAGKVKFIL